MDENSKIQFDGFTGKVINNVEPVKFGGFKPFPTSNENLSYKF